MTSQSRLGPRLAAALDARWEHLLVRVCGRRGWRPTPVVFNSYARSAGVEGGGWARVLCRVLMLPRSAEGGSHARDGLSRGWRRYFTAPVAGVEVIVRIGADGPHERVHRVRTAAGGYLDLRLEADLPLGQHDVVVEAPGGAMARGVVHVVDPDVARGLVSDIDDTAMITLLPKPLRAFWNTFVMQEVERRPVPGMAKFLRSQAADTGLMVYLSTGAWNYAPVIEAFLKRHHFPPGALLMTDWGPSAQRFFRSGTEHKRTQLRRLTHEFPEIRWRLVGDDGQHDPETYSSFARAYPDRVETVAIRTLTPVEHLVTGAPQTREEAEGRVQVPGSVRVLRGGDGNALLVEDLGL
ncbi:App1 family protein [Serinibacter salmoneus]|uniref:Uncharacterized protein DUF2183 n=1 Tax=Serinibacter salmoneus TaxID=556530 RepID=A0A2A9CWP4_9MICO|nr:phosphatase domain-containing protein [Serinibacter salmoneus]PFG18848.1 uncharacterized protein DUF2183 [Serinibacter salmoneus]